ncbi:SH3 domain-containing protein [Roseospirillum parvum]|uniref:SH3 domain-containing protein n=1 Tax=Roseospirillum parvum TaxID=83401 RepID=A0A1G7WRM1_9PROT|nr:hypothetical protein [Roseospirillum parvum]SDG74581.1 hypothetical protein SAMN05421742_102298 [Roseospirillum parvum]
MPRLRASLSWAGLSMLAVILTACVTTPQSTPRKVTPEQWMAARKVCDSTCQQFLGIQSAQAFDQGVQGYWLIESKFVHYSNDRSFNDDRIWMLVEVSGAPFIKGEYGNYRVPSMVYPARIHAFLGVRYDDSGQPGMLNIETSGPDEALEWIQYSIARAEEEFGVQIDLVKGADEKYYEISHGTNIPASKDNETLYSPQDYQFIYDGRSGYGSGFQFVIPYFFNFYGKGPVTCNTLSRHGYCEYRNGKLIASHGKPVREIQGALVNGYDLSVIDKLSDSEAQDFLTNTFPRLVEEKSQVAFLDREFAHSDVLRGVSERKYTALMADYEQHYGTGSGGQAAGQSPATPAKPRSSATGGQSGASAPGAETLFVNKNANLRAGPGTGFAKVGRKEAGAAIQVVGKSEDGEWLRLEDGNWIYEPLTGPEKAGNEQTGDVSAAGLAWVSECHDQYTSGYCRQETVAYKRHELEEGPLTKFSCREGAQIFRRCHNELTSDYCRRMSEFEAQKLDNLARNYPEQCGRPARSREEPAAPRAPSGPTRLQTR